MRLNRGFWIAVAFLFSSLMAWSAPPPNDSFSNRIILTGTQVTTTGSNVNASKQTGEPGHAGNAGGKSVWWAWTAPTNGDLTITTDGSLASDGRIMDTLLGVYTGSSVSGLSLVKSNEDHGVVLTSRVRLYALAGTQYQIAVDGFNDGTIVETGNISLALSFVSEPITRPGNDDFTNRPAVTGTPIVLTGSNVNASRQSGEPLHAGMDGDTSVWWRWTAPSNDTVRVTTAGSSFDTLLAIYTGSLVSNLTELASNDDEDIVNGIATSSVILGVMAGQQYQIAVDAYDGAWGQVVLRIDSVVPRFAAPVWTNGVFRFDLIGATGTTNEIQGSENLANWTTLGTLVMTNVTVGLEDTTAANHSQRFYRAILR